MKRETVNFKELNDYCDSVYDYIEDFKDVKTYTIHDVIKTNDTLFVVGSNHIVRSHHGLSEIKRFDNKWDSVHLTDSYLNAVYLKLE